MAIATSARTILPATSATTVKLYMRIDSGVETDSPFNSVILSMQVNQPTKPTMISFAILLRKSASDCDEKSRLRPVNGLILLNLEKNKSLMQDSKIGYSFQTAINTSKKFKNNRPHYKMDFYA